MKTSEIAEALWGDKPYQKKARRIFPILVRQAEAKSTIYYSDLAKELDISNARNLNYPLGSIGKSINQLTKEWGEKIPLIQTIVINKQNNLPGEGYYPFLKNTNIENLTLQDKIVLLKGTMQDVFWYPKWRDVLQYFDLPYYNEDHKETFDKISNYKNKGESEGEEHKKLKIHVSKNKHLVKHNSNNFDCEFEYILPSGDRLDVSFLSKKEWTAVEVKPSTSPIEDITRGIFQCIKYRAIMEACSIVQRKNINIRAVLVLGGSFPDELLSIKNQLSVEVIDNIVPL